MDTLLGLFIGLGLSAACGFRLIVPFLIISISALSGHLTLAPDMTWMGTYPALVTFGIATLLEILVYFIPWVDDIMATLAIPISFVAGTLLTAAFVPEMSPLLRWSLAAIAGGTVAGTTETLTTSLRFASTAATGGLGNGLLSVGELLSSAVLSLLALLVPIVALLVVIFFLTWSIRKGIGLVSIFRRQRAHPPSDL